MLSRAAKSCRIGQSPIIRSTLSKMSYSTVAEDDVIFENINTTKVITLNRPSKLNSLNESMIDKLYPHLLEYSKSDITSLIIQKSNGRAFCAGGDVVACAVANQAGKIDESITFFQKEYSLNELYAGYKKPIVSLIDGITMGGGVGLSIHTPFRVATEKTRLAMPEMDIGFFPDVGTTFALNKLVSPSLGWYLALTGESVFGLDTYFSGLATHFVPSHRIPELEKALTLVDVQNADSFVVVNNVIEEFTEPLPEDYKFKYTTEQLKLIENVFNKDATIERIFELLEKEGSEFATKTLETLQKKSPLSLKVSLELLHLGADANIHDTLTQELHAAKQLMISSDFNEGVSSKLIKKSKDVPNWKHKTPAEVNKREIIALLKPDSQLKLDRHSNITFTEYPHNFGLPKDSEIEAFLTGAFKFGEISKKDFIQHFAGKYKQKAGIYEYLKFVLSTKFADYKL